MSIYEHAFRVYVKSVATAPLEPYDCRRHSATCYFQAHVADALIAELGGW